MLENTTQIAENLFYSNLGRWVEELIVRRDEEPNKEKKKEKRNFFINEMCFKFDAWLKGREQCGSPIEELFLSELLFQSDGFNDLYYNHDPENRVIRKFGTCICQQAHLGNYKADFLFELHLNSKSKKIAVECDGHDFHEKTKEQARHDKRRDRAFLKNNIIVLRFTGSEIYQSPQKCGDEVSAILFLEMEKMITSEEGS